jgi:hypothetical protein
MAASCDPRPVPFLKRLFIWRSALADDNGRMDAVCHHRGLTKGRRSGWTFGRRAAVLALLLCPLAAGAREHEHRGHDEPEHDHDRARRAVQAGEILPLQELLNRLSRRQPGQVLEVELERESGRWVYEIKLLQPDGRLLKMQLDARNAAPLAPGPEGRR